jgi:hypothetical protein
LFDKNPAIIINNENTPENKHKKNKLYSTSQIAILGPQTKLTQNKKLNIKIITGIIKYTNLLIKFKTLICLITNFIASAIYCNLPRYPV